MSNKSIQDWDREYSWDFTKEWREKPLIGDRRMDVCPLCHLKPCMKDCYNASATGYSGTEADYKERGRRDLE